MFTGSKNRTASVPGPSLMSTTAFDLMEKKIKQWIPLKKLNGLKRRMRRVWICYRSSYKAAKATVFPLTWMRSIWGKYVGWISFFKNFIIYNFKFLFALSSALIPIQIFCSFFWPHLILHCCALQLLAFLHLSTFCPLDLLLYSPWSKVVKQNLIPYVLL